MAENYFEQFVAPGLQRDAQREQLGMQQRQLGMDEAKFAYGLQQQQQQQARQQAFTEQFGKAWASGDKEALVNIGAQFPDQIETIQKAVGFRDDTQKQTIGKLGLELNAAIKSGRTDAAARIIAENAETLRGYGPGYEPETLLQELQEDPVALADAADKMSLIALGPEEYYKVMNQREQQATARRGQDVQVRGQNMSAATASADRAERARIKSEEFGLKLKELGMKPSIDAKDIKGINSDISSFKKDADVMYGAAVDLQTIRENATPAAQLAAIFKFMKALDPTSVVREGEQVMLQKTGGVYDSVGNYVSRLNNGSRLNADQLKDLANTAKRLANSSASTVNKSIDDYLSTYGENLTEDQKKLFTRRKVKTFDVAASAADDVNEGSRYKPDASAASTPTTSVAEMSNEQLLKKLGL